MIAKMVYVRLKVTIFLFLRPNNRAKSGSTIMAVNVDKDTERNTQPVTPVARNHE